jgi:putative transposase
MTLFRCRFRVELLKTPKIRNNVVIDEWVIMPDHIHVIFKILSPKIHTPSGETKNRFGPQSDNLAAIVRGFKSAVKKQTNLSVLEFHWEPRYHDHIIRDEEELTRIRYYIRKKVATWGRKSENR